MKVIGWTIQNFKELVKKKKIDFPQDVKKQLFGAINSVFLSWESQRAKTYRKLNQIPDHWGTAVNVQAMVLEIWVKIVLLAWLSQETPQQVRNYFGF